MENLRVAMWNQRARSGESPESSEIELEEPHRHNEHPKSPLIPELTKPPSKTHAGSLAAGSFKKWLSSRSVSINVQSPERVDLRENSMESPTLRDLKLGGLFKYHLNDWLLIVIIFIIWLASFLIHPFQRYVGAKNFENAQLRYPFKSNTIPFQSVPAIAVGIPLVVILGIFFKRRNTRDLHHAILGLLTTIALTALITDVVKIGIGRPRPHFYARCFGSPNATPNYDLTGNVICSATKEQMKEAYKSFPSGHTSWVFAGLSYLAIYMAGKLSIFDRKGHSWKIFPIVVTMLGATFVGVTRIDDYWHHWTDVCTGAAIGIVTAYFCYRQHFRSLFDDLPHMTYDYVPHARTRPVPARQASAPAAPVYDDDRVGELSFAGGRSEYYDAERGRVQSYAGGPSDYNVEQGRMQSFAGGPPDHNVERGRVQSFAGGPPDYNVERGRVQSFAGGPPDYNVERGRIQSFAGGPPDYNVERGRIQSIDTRS